MRVRVRVKVRDRVGIRVRVRVRVGARCSRRSPPSTAAVGRRAAIRRG